MSFTREYLESLDIEKEKIESIITAYSESEAEKTAEFRQKLDSKEKEIEEIKSGFAKKEADAHRRAVLLENLKKSGYSDASANLIVNRSDFAERLEIAENGTPVNLDAVISEIQADADFSGFTPKIEDFVHKPSAPPANANSGWTKEKIMSVRNTAERQALIAKNPRIFGL